MRSPSSHGPQAARRAPAVLACVLLALAMAQAVRAYAAPGQGGGTGGVPTRMANRGELSSGPSVTAPVP